MWKIFPMIFYNDMLDDDKIAEESYRGFVSVDYIKKIRRKLNKNFDKGGVLYYCVIYIIVIMKLLD
jgi:hypothetical protein